MAAGALGENWARRLKRVHVARFHAACHPPALEWNDKSAVRIVFLRPCTFPSRAWLSAEGTHDFSLSLRKHMDLLYVWRCSNLTPGIGHMTVSESCVMSKNESFTPILYITYTSTDKPAAITESVFSPQFCNAESKAKSQKSPEYNNWECKLLKKEHKFGMLDGTTESSSSFHHGCIVYLSFLKASGSMERMLCKPRAHRGKNNKKTNIIPSPTGFEMQMENYAFPHANCCEAS